MAFSTSGKYAKGGSNIGLTAAAFQDHLMKSCNLNFNDGVARTKKPGVNKKRSDSNNKKGKSEPKQEYVIRESKNIQTTSLAERLGIIDSPAGKLLSETQWRELKKKCRERKELSEPCSICKEFYTHAKEQVLLSCSHVFHRKCVGSFEKYSGQKSCPICRCKNYEKRVIFDGATLTAYRCATKIQSQWRRYIMEKKYLRLRQTVPPKDERLRKEFYKSKFLNICDKVAKRYEEHEEDVSQFISCIDENIACSRSVMKKFNHSHMNALDWESVESNAIRRDFKDCPICLSALQKPRKSTVLLSCSHMFHAQCLSAYEKFTESSNPVCPVCRTDYVKQSVPDTGVSS